MCMKGRAMKTDPRYLLANLYQTISKVWLLKMVVRQILSWEVYACINVLHEDHEDYQTRRYSNPSYAFIQHGRFDLRLENSW